MSSSAVKTLVLASPVLFLGSLSDSVDARNESITIQTKGTATACEECRDPLPSQDLLALCVKEYQTSRFNWFFRTASGEDHRRCGCCPTTFVLANGGYSTIKISDPSSNNVICWTKDNNGVATQTWYTNSPLHC